MTFLGRIWSELSFEEKVFVHAELTPMAKPKKPIVTTTKVELVKVQIKTAIDSHTGRTPPRYRTYRTKARRTVVYLLFVGVEGKARTSGGSSGIIRFFPDLKCLLGRGGGGLKVLVRSIGDGKGVQELGVLILGDLAKAPSQCKCLGRASECFVRCGRQEQ